MIDHLGITVSDFDASKAFYDKAMAPLGASLLMMVPPEYTGGVKVGGYGRDRPTFWMQEGERQKDHQHVAFTARSRAEVDAFYAAAIAAGGRDNGGPGLRPHLSSELLRRLRLRSRRQQCRSRLPRSGIGSETR